ncbi:MAG: ABC transporter permease [Actinomycetota bacterium]|nr:ABC transporter permease [Actinomycetota bacterium]
MKKIIKKIQKNEQVSLIIILIAIVCVFTAIQPNYFSVRNLINILFSASIVGMVAFGETFLIIGGQIDLSPGAVAAFSGVLAAILLNAGVPMILTIFIVIAMAMLIGYLISLMINFLKMEPFIVTLAIMSVFTGLAFIIGGGRSIPITNKSFIYFGAGDIFGIPISIVIFAVIFVIFHIILTRTRFGRTVYMVGGNEAASRLAGINPKKIKTMLYLITPVMASIGGMILAGRMNSGQPTAQSHLMFGALTAAIVGGVRFGGGKGTLYGCLIGVLLLESFKNGIAVLNVQTFWQNVASGVLLIVALSADYARTARNK